MIYSDASHPVQVKMRIEKASALRSLCAHIFLKSVQNLEHFWREYRPVLFNKLFKLREQTAVHSSAIDAHNVRETHITPERLKQVTALRTYH